MLIDINSWMQKLAEVLKKTFGARLLFVGLQGSYRRGEAHKQSDIDAVVILDTLSMEDIATYRKILSKLPGCDQACGFISGRQELANWPRHELFQFARDTVSFYGELQGLLPEIGRADIVQGAKVGAAGLYHACVHMAVHNHENAGALCGLYKGAFFLLQSVYYLRSGAYADTKKALLPLLEGEEKEILDVCMDPDDCARKIFANPDIYFRLLIDYCAQVLEETF